MPMDIVKNNRDLSGEQLRGGWRRMMLAASGEMVVQLDI